MKTLFLFLASIAITVNLSAQTRAIYGLLKKSDGTIIKGSSVKKGFENQILITNYSGGSDNSATIEIEVPTGAYVADIRNIMNASLAASQPKLSVKSTTTSGVTIPKITRIDSTINLSTIKPAPNITVLQPTSPTLSRFEISVIEVPQADSDRSYFIKSRIIMEDLKIESCTDDALSGKSKIKLKAVRIGWIYYSYDPVNRKLTGSSKSGWNTICNCSWTNF
ncbi:MAG: hypothetical protein ACK5NK_12520 [Niabella sp.]